MAIKRKIREEEEIEAGEGMKTEARLDSLPESLQLHVLSFLDVKQLIQTSVLSRTWVRLWTSTPVLDLNSIAFNKIYDFDKFVSNVLRFRDQTATLKRLTFSRRGACSAKILKKVIDYAFFHKVKQLEVSIERSRNKIWPVCLHTSSHSLTSLILQSNSLFSCPFLWSRFKNLTVLHLQRAVITNLEQFSGFPMLEKLILRDCRFTTDGEILRVHALQLSDLTISGYLSPKGCELTTPKLRFFEHQGSTFPLLQTHDGLPVLHTVVIGFTGNFQNMDKKRMFADLLSLFRSLQNAKSLTLLLSTVDLLISLFQENSVNTNSPFRNLKCLNLDLRYLWHQNTFAKPLKSVESVEIPSGLKAYLLQNSPEAKFTIIYSKSIG